MTENFQNPLELENDQEVQLINTRKIVQEKPNSQFIDQRPLTEINLEDTAQLKMLAEVDLAKINRDRDDKLEVVLN